MLQKSLLFAAVCLFALHVQCEDRRNVHRIILKTERSKKHIAKKPNMQHHKVRDHEAHGSIVHEDFAIPSRYNFSPDLQDLIKPRPPHPHDFLITYPEEQLNFDHTYNVDTNAWSPVTGYEPDQSSGTRNSKKKLRRKPSTQEPFLDFTTSKPLKSVHPVHFEHYVNFKKIAKKPPVKMHNSYEVYEEVQENESPPKSKKSAITAFNNLSPLPYSFKNSNYFLPTVTTYTQDVKYGIRVKGRKSH